MEKHYDKFIGFAKETLFVKFFWKCNVATRVAYWAFNNPKTLNDSNFKMLSDLFGLIMKVANENKPLITHIAYLHPEEGDKQIVSIWAGAGLGADPIQRITELVNENNELKNKISVLVKKQAF